MCVDDEVISILDEVVSYGSTDEDHIRHVHIGTPKHNVVYIKWNYIELYFIDKINTDTKFDSTIFFYLYFGLLVDPSKWIWARMVINLQSQYVG